MFLIHYFLKNLCYFDNILVTCKVEMEYFAFSCVVLRQRAKALKSRFRSPRQFDKHPDNLYTYAPAILLFYLTD